MAAAGPALPRTMLAAMIAEMVFTFDSFGFDDRSMRTNLVPLQGTIPIIFWTTTLLTWHQFGASFRL